jgi:uncharacterized protein
MKRFLILGLSWTLFMSVSLAWAQKPFHLSIATGGTGGIYYPIGSGMASLISKHISNTDATAEVTNASIDNCRLINQQKVNLALTGADVAWEAYQGKGKEFKEKVPLRTVAVIYPVFMHLVTLGDKGIDKVTDLKGKKVSTGAPGSWTDLTSTRILEAYRLNPDKDVVRSRLGPSDSSADLREKKLDAFFWGGGIPTASLSELAMSPGMQFKLISPAEAVPMMREKYGPVYVTGVIPAKSYFSQDVDVSVPVVWNLLVCHENFREDLAYQIIKTFMEHQPELSAFQREARFLTPQSQAGGGSPIPFHPGTLRYLAEKGMKVK